MVIDIEVVNWEKHNGRTDVKHPTWFKFSNNIFEDPVISKLKSSEFKVWVYILTLCSKAQQSSIRLDTDLVQTFCRVRTEFVQSSIRALTEFGRLRLTEPNDIDKLSTVRVTLDKNRLDKRREEENTYVAKATPVRTRPRKDALPVSAKKASIPNHVFAVWESYRDAYASRYGNPPPENPKNWGLCKSFCTRLSVDVAPQVAKFYLTHNDQFYVRQVHPLTAMVKDAEKLHTEWLAGKQMTSSHARQIETIASTASAVEAFLKSSGE